MTSPQSSSSHIARRHYLLRIVATSQQSVPLLEGMFVASPWIAERVEGLLECLPDRLKGVVEEMETEEIRDAWGHLIRRVPKYPMPPLSGTD